MISTAITGEIFHDEYQRSLSSGHDEYEQAINWLFYHIDCRNQMFTFVQYVIEQDSIWVYLSSCNFLVVSSF